MTHATSKFVFRLSSLSVACTATESSHAVTSVRLDLAIDSVDWKLVETQLGPPPGAEPKLPDVSSRLGVSGSLLLTPGRPAAAVSVSVSIPTDFPRAANLMTREGCLNGESLGRICHG